MPHDTGPDSVRRAVLAAWAAAVLGLASGPSAAELLHEERSLYRNILVTRDYNQICLKFSVRSDQRNQSCFYPRNPRRMVFSYTRMMMASLLLNPHPRRVLVIGLGGGTLPTALHELYPSARIDAVEIDPAVVRIAEQFFDFQPSEQVVVHVQDARVFTKRALRRPDRYDLILLDAFNGDYIPEHLMTREYLAETAALLTADGVLAANTFSISDLYDHESVTYQAVFGSFLNFRIAESANRVVLVASAGVPVDEILAERAAALAPRLQPYNVPIRRYARSLDGRRDWDPRARPLTDEYSPANLLQGR